MATFREMQEQVLAARNKKEVLSHIVDYLEENFRSSGSDPKRILVKDDKTAVPDSTFEEVVSELLHDVQNLDNALKSMLDAEVKPSTK